MSELWWLQPGWKGGCCAECGANIWDSGGDPDWGLCFEHFSQKVERERAQRALAPPDPAQEGR